MPDKFGFTTWDDLYSQLWKGLGRAMTNQFLEEKNEQGKFYSQLSKLVISSKDFTGDVVAVDDDGKEWTDWEYLDRELNTAKEMFCGGIDCMDPGQGTIGKAIAILDTVRNKNYQIYENNQLALDNLIGTPDQVARASQFNPETGEPTAFVNSETGAALPFFDPDTGESQYTDGDIIQKGEKGILKQIHDLQGDILNWEGTDGAVQVLNDLTQSYHNLGGLAKEGIKKQYQDAMGDIQGSINAFDVIGRNDMDKDNPALDMADPKTEPVLYAVGQLLQIGDSKGAMGLWKQWLKNEDKLILDDRKLAKEESKQFANLFNDKLKEIRASEIFAASGAGQGAQKFINSIKFKMSKQTWDKTGLNSENMAERRGIIAANLAGMLEPASGAFKNNWEMAKSQANAYLKEKHGINYNPTETEITDIAINSLFADMDANTLENTLSDDVDFPGITWGWGYGHEQISNNYFKQMVELYQITDDAHQHMMLHEVPGNTKTAPGNQNSDDPFNANLVSGGTVQSILTPSGFVKEYGNIDDSGLNNFAIDPSVNTGAENSVTLNSMVMAFSTAVTNQADPKATIDFILKDVAPKSIVNYEIKTWKDKDGNTHRTLLIGNDQWQDEESAKIDSTMVIGMNNTIGYGNEVDSILGAFDDVDPDSLMAALPNNSGFIKDEDALIFNPDYTGEDAAYDGDEVLKALETMADSTGQSFPIDDTIVSHMSQDEIDQFVENVSDEASKNQIDAELKFLLGDSQLVESANSINKSSAWLAADYLKAREQMLSTATYPDVNELAPSELVLRYMSEFGVNDDEEEDLESAIFAE
jgi:hypothetical protein